MVASLANCHLFGCGLALFATDTSWCYEMDNPLALPILAHYSQSNGLNFEKWRTPVVEYQVETTLVEDWIWKNGSVKD